MDELKNLTDPNSVLQITNVLLKISKSIQKQKHVENISENNIKEIEFLKEQCQSSNIQLSLLSCQSLVHLVEDGVLQPNKVMTMFISMLSISGGTNFAAISEGIVSLLMIDLRQRSIQSKLSDAYKCPFGMKPPQHPLIMILQKKEANINDMANKISAICNHHDKEISKNSIGFLRPVFLYVLCNPNVIPDSKAIWCCLLNQTIISREAMDLLYEIFSWNRCGSPATCLKMSIFLTEAIQFMLNANQTSVVLDLHMYQVALLRDLVTLGYDPRPSLAVMYQTLHATKKHIGERSEDLFNYMLILIAELLHIVSSVYLIDILRILRYIIESEGQGNIITLNMVLDGLIIRLASATKFPSTDCRLECESLIKYITSSEKSLISTIMTNNKTAEYKCSWRKSVKYQNLNIAIAFDLAILSRHLLAINSDRDIKNPNLTKFVIGLQKREFTGQTQLFLRALLLCPPHIIQQDLWVKIWLSLMAVVRENVSVSVDMIYFVLYVLAQETNGEKQIAILRGLADFAFVKENIPLILNTYRALSTSSSPSLQALSFDLHVRLWKNENRSYQFLHKMLSNEFKMSKMDTWEMNIVKAHSIKEICELKPSQHGKDLVIHLSDILNSCSDERNDLATSLTLDSIVLLCNSHTVNMASTWKALGGKFRNEKRTRSIRSLCKFFGEVPLLQSPTPDYEKLFYESLDQLWAYITDFDTTDIIVPALQALKNFSISELALKHIPPIFQEDLRVPSEFQKIIAVSATDPESKQILTPTDVIPYIPGECWIQLLEKVNMCAIDAAADLLQHYIECEISQFRSGVYMLTGGRSEPSDLPQLHARSPLKAVTKLIAAQSKLSHGHNTPVLINSLKCLSKKFSKPFPPFDWFFLLDLLDKSFEGEEFPYQIRKYCLTIAANQIAHSGSARNLVENYLQQFNASSCYNEEIAVVVELVPLMCNGAATPILKQFLDNVTDFAYQQSVSSHFEDKCLLGETFIALALIYKDKCLIPENTELITQVFRKYYSLLEPDTKFFALFSKILTELPSEELFTLTTPKSWTENNFQKSALVRFILCESFKSYAGDKNSLLWLNAIIDNATRENQRAFVTRNVFRILTSNICSDKHICDWLMYLLGKMQSVLTTDETVSKISTASFLIDIFMQSILIVSGLFVLSNTAPSLRMHFVDLFPEALASISTRPHWKDCIVRIFEFLNHMLTTQGIFMSDILETTRNALICCKNNDYFLQKATWMKYTGLDKK